MNTPPSITSLTATAGNSLLSISYAQSGATTIQYKVNTGSYITITTATSGTFTVSGLIPGVQYTITLACTNSNGTTPRTVLGTPIGIPTNVSISSIVSNELNTIMVTYSCTINGSAITNARYICEPSGSVTVTSPNISVGITNTFTISGLTGGITYFVRIILTNAVGNSSVTANSFTTVLGYPTKPTISFISTPMFWLDTLDINYSSTYYGSNVSVLTAYSDFAAKIENPTFTTGATIIPPNSVGTSVTIPNWSTVTGQSGAVHIGNGNTGYIQNLPSTVTQYAILVAANSNSFAQISKNINFEQGYYQFIFMGYKQTPSQGDILNISVGLTTSNGIAININKLMYGYHWVEYNVGFYIPVAGQYLFRIHYSSPNGGALPNSISLTNAYIVRGFIPTDPTYYTNKFNDYKTSSIFTTLANNSFTASTSGFGIVVSYIGKGTTTYAPGASGEGYQVFSAGSAGRLNGLVYSGTFLITFNACTKYASATLDALQVYVTTPTGNAITDTLQSVNITTSSWASYTISVNITLPSTSYPEFYSNYDSGRYVNFKYYTTNATQPNFLSIKDVVITPISLYKSVNLSSNPTLRLSNYSGFNSYPISVMIHNKIGGRSLLSEPVTGVPRSAPAKPTISSITSTASRKLNLFWSVSLPIGTTVADVEYSVNGGTFVSGGISNPLVVSNLSGGIMYSFKIKVTNQYATSEDSDIGYGMPVDLLSQPIITDITEPSKNTIAIYWKDDLNDLLDDVNGMVISSIKYSLDNGVTYISTGTSNPIILTGLSGGLLYPVKIKASNVSSGDSIESLVSYGAPYDNPGKPIITSITATTKKQLNIYWTDSSNGANITSLKYSINGTTPSIDVSAANPFVISGLTGGTTYQIRIIAVNIGGNSIQSDIYNAIPFDVPGKPAVESISYVNQYYYVNWTDISNGSGITEVKYTIDGSDTYISGGTSDPFAISDLSSGRIYPLKIKAFNSAGESAVSDVYNIVPINSGSGSSGTAPTIHAPSILYVTPENESISVGFTHTETVGYPTITYQYRLNGGEFLNSPYKSSPLIISGLTNGTAYYVQMTAINGAGTSSLSNQSLTVTPRDSPDTPVLVSADASNASIICSFQSASNNGGTQKSYKYSLNDGSYSDVLASALDVSNQRITISGLTNGTTYSVRIKQVNEYGDSSASNAISGIIPYTLPSAPTINQVFTASTQAIVNYSEGSSNGYPILFYSYTIDGGVTYYPISSSSSSFTIYGISPSTAYTIKMKSNNQKGSSIESSPNTFTTSSTTTAPVIVSALPGNNIITVNFMNGELTGSNLFGYSYSINDSAYQIINLQDVSNNSFIIPNLINGISYSVSMKMITNNGSSNPSNQIPDIIPYTNPSPPTITNITVISTQATVYFDLSNSNGYPITKLEYSLDGGNSFITAPSIVSPFIIYGLIDGIEYTVYLRAVHEKGTSQLSGLYNFTPADLPSPPIISSISSGNRIVTVNFVNGSLNGGDVTGYSVSLNAGVYTPISESDISGQTLIIRNLTNGTSYAVTMKTITSKGTSSSSIANTGNIPFDAPSPPIITNISVYSSYALITFTEPSSNGYPILGYKYSLDGTNYINAPGYPASPIALYGFIDGSQNTIQLKAYHAKGTSAASNSTSFTTRDTPESPVITSVDEGNSSLVVNFTERNLRGGTLTGYSVSVNDSSYTAVSPSDISGNSFIISGLTNGTAYSISMKTITNIRASLISNVVFDNIPFSLPSAPTITNVSVVSGSATISFTAGEANGYPILGYHILVNDNSFVSALWSPSTSTIQLNGLTDGVSNTVKIRSYHAKGASSLSNQISFITKDIPEPSIISSIHENNSSLLVYFTNGNLRGGLLTGYLVSINDSSYSPVSASDISGNTINIRNLTNGTKYSVSMKTVTDMGSSPMSNIISDNIPFSIPSAPTITSVDLSVGSAAINFTPGNNNGYPILGYQISINDSSFINAAWESSSSVISLNGLSNGIATAIKIRAYHAKGISVNSNTYTFTTNGTPDAPIIIDANTGNAVATITFQNNNLYGGNVVKYSYSFNSADFIDISSSDLSGNTFTLSGLTNEQSYSVSMKVTTDIGTSQESNVRTGIIPFTAPSAPVISSVIAGNKEALVSFQPSVSYSTESVIINYQYSLDGGNTYNWCSSINNNSFKITELDAKTEYTAVIRSYSKYGFSANSSPSSAFIPYSVPSIPVITNVVPSNQQILVYIQTPESNGNAITSYLYSLNGEDYLTTNDITSPITIASLTNKTKYSLTLKAVNDAGASEASLPTTQTVPFYLPNTPIISGIRPMNQSAIVDLSNTDLNGDTIIGYKYSFNSTVWYDVSANPSSPFSFTINGLTNGTSYTIFVKIVSQSGTTASTSISQSFVPRNVPNPPIITSITPADKSVLVYFTDSSSNGSAIKEYWYSANGSAYRLALQHTSPIIVYGLDNGIIYTITIKSVNDAGFSNGSAPSSTVTPFGVPSTPFIRNAYPGNGSSLVYFDEINGNGSPIEKIQYSMGPSWNDLSANSSPFLIPGLTNKTGPSVSIRAKNIAGYSYSSNIVRVMVGTPYPPTITNVVTGSKQLTVHFNISVTNSPITSIYYKAVGSSSSAVKAIGTTSPIIIPKLINGTQYSFKLQLANLNGFSLESAPSDIVVPAGVPTAPIILSVVRSDINQVRITLGTVQDNGSSIIKYYYSIGTETTLRDISGLDQTFVLGGLEPNMAYSFKVYAENGVGMSLPSKASKSIVNVFTPPIAPSKISTLARLNQLSVSFIPPPTPLFLPITGYQYVLNGRGNSSDVYTDASTIQLPLLIPINNNTLYNVRIKAVNAAGSSSASTATTQVSYIYLPPTFPVIKSIMSMGNGTAYVYYTASTSRNAPVTGYVYTLDGSNAFVSMEMSGNILIARDLSDNIPITTFKIAANSAAGYSNLSTVASSFTVITGAPSVPVLNAPDISGNRATIVFPVPPANGSPIIEYTYIITNTITRTTSLATFTSSPITINNIPNGSYSIIVKARNALGTSANSAAKTFTINVV